MRYQEFTDDQVFSLTLIADALRTARSEIPGRSGLEAVSARKMVHRDRRRLERKAAS